MSDEQTDSRGMAAVPDGFVPYSEPSPFLDRIGPIFERMEEGRRIIATRVQPYQCNRRGFAHGGLYTALADVALGKNLSAGREPPVPLVTSSLTVDFIAAARVGDLLEVRTEFTRLGRRIAFANAYLLVAERTVARANAVFAVLGEGNS
tara:strand:+ start:967 stop:1413 length:447 start_codon:yes stop_codon:yes gene_type:complete